jgi:hypothetical protein
MRMHDNNDAKNIISVYKRVKKFHSIALLNPNTILRGGRLVNKRIAKDLFEFGLTFIIAMDLIHGKEAVFAAIKIYPFYVFKPKVMTSCFLLLIPEKATRFFLKIFEKIAPVY